MAFADSTARIAVLLMGIAAGIRDKVRIGEVVLSDRVVAYEPAALVRSAGGTRVHVATAITGVGLHRRSRAGGLAGGWKSRGGFDDGAMIILDVAGPGGPHREVVQQGEHPAVKAIHDEVMRHLR